MCHLQLLSGGRSQLQAGTWGLCRGWFLHCIEGSGGVRFAAIELHDSLDNYAKGRPAFAERGTPDLAIQSRSRLRQSQILVDRRRDLAHAPGMIGLFRTTVAHKRRHDALLHVAERQ